MLVSNSWSILTRAYCVVFFGMVSSKFIVRYQLQWAVLVASGKWASRSELTSSDELRGLGYSVVTHAEASRQQWSSEQQADSSWIGSRINSSSEHLGQQRAESERADSLDIKYYSKPLQNSTKCSETFVSFTRYSVINEQRVGEQHTTRQRIDSSFLNELFNRRLDQ